MLTPILSLWQPYATLVFRRIKKHETRGRSIPDKHVGATIAIHSTAKFPPHNKISEELHELCMAEFGCGYNYSLPCGYILGTVRIGASLPTATTPPVDDDDRICGDWRPGRFAMPLSEIGALPTLVAAKGHQSWWYRDLELPSVSEQPKIEDGDYHQYILGR